MSQALDFLNRKKTYNKTKSRHNAICKDKQDKFISENGTTKCEDQNLVKDGGSGKLRVNERFVYKSSLPKLASRAYHEREQKACEACGDMFTPKKLRRPPTVHEKELGIGEFVIWCDLCQKKGTPYRDFIRRIGGLEKYNILLSELEDYNEVWKSDNFRVLDEELNKRLYLRKPVQKLRNRVAGLINRAWNENEKRATRDSHYKFDF